MELGVQLYGLMELFRDDPAGSLRALAKAGYTEIEPCIAFGTTLEVMRQNHENPVWMPEEVRGFQKLAADCGLALHSCHILGDAAPHIPELTALAEQTGLHAFVVGCPVEEARFDEQVASLCTVADALEQGGVDLWLHNLYPEIQTLRDGVTYYEAVLSACGGCVCAQVDTGWVRYAGEDPLSLMRRIEPMLASVHHKDIRGDHTQIPPEAHPIALGDGMLDTPAIKAYADALGVAQLIDQDSSFGDFFADLRQSAHFLASLS